MFKVYLAGPEVFLPDAPSMGRKMKALCRSCNVLGLYPMDNEPNPAATEALATAIFRGNIAMMREADAILANLTPFRSVSADPGTVFEVGFGYALGKPIYGYSHVPGSLLDRVKASQADEPLRVGTDGRAYGADGLAVEQFGHVDNLMICEAIDRSGGAFLARTGDGWRDLSLFRDILRVVSERASHQAATAA